MKNYSLRFGSGDPRTLTGLSPTFLIFVRLTDGATITPPAITESATNWGIYQFSWGTTQPIAFLADAATTSPGSTGRYVTGQVDPSDRSDEYGTTLVALGNTSIALGTTAVAIGTTLTFNVPANMGATLTAIGNTSIAYGGTINALVTNVGTTLVAVGNTSIAYGGTISQVLTNTGATLVAIGNSSTALGTTAVAIGTTIQSYLSGLSSPILVAIGSTASAIGDATTDPGDLFGYLKRIAELAQGQERFVKGSGLLTMYERTGATTLATRTVTNNASLVIKS